MIIFACLYIILTPYLLKRNFMHNCPSPIFTSGYWQCTSPTPHMWHSCTEIWSPTWCGRACDIQSPQSVTSSFKQACSFVCVCCTNGTFPVHHDMTWKRPSSTSLENPLPLFKPVISWSNVQYRLKLIFFYIFNI